MTQLGVDQNYLEFLSPQQAAALAISSHIANPEEPACLVPSPKQNGSGSLGRASWYPYYAGYSAEFVRSVLIQCNPRIGAVVLDPWNGGGTTTQVANDLGYGVVGFDLNPAMVLVAKARLLNQCQVSKLRQALETIIKVRKSYRTKKYIENDPLRLWLSDDTVREVRHIERAIRQVLEPNATNDCLDANNATSHVAFAYLALFRTLRECVSGFKVSNPVWLKTAKSENERVSCVGKEFATKFSQYFLSLLNAYDFDPFLECEDNGDRQNPKRIEVANSVNLPLATHPADIVVSSPPYCTRIDYAVATSVELAVLGIDPRDSLRELRDQMIGTSTIHAVVPEINAQWGKSCGDLLSRIAEHRSKASKSYYLKTHVQYFDGMYRSLMEINRCLRPGGHCVLVLQDSYYKDIHNDLPQIVAEMADSLGWQLRCRNNFRVFRTMAGRNGHYRQYRPTNVATESVLWFLTPEQRD